MTATTVLWVKLYGKFQHEPSAIKCVNPPHVNYEKGSFPRLSVVRWRLI